MDGMQVLGGDVDTMSSILVGEDVEVCAANHAGEVAGKGGEVSVALFRSKFVRIIQVVHFGRWRRWGEVMWR